LLLEEKLVELMLRYGDRVITRTDQDNQTYKISVIEEIIHHFSEDDYELQTPLNKKIVGEIQDGLKSNTLRSGDFFATLMDEELSSKAADVLIDQYQTSDWSKHNIYFSKEEELVPKIISDIMIRHKREYIVKLIDQMKNQLETTEDKNEIYMKIIALSQLKNTIDHQMYRVL
jgi:DNA primase